MEGDGKGGKHHAQYGWKMHHPVTDHKQLNGQTHEKAGHKRKEQGQMTM